VGERYAHGGGLLQSDEWIRQDFQPPKNGRKAARNECSAYIYWEKGHLADVRKTDTAGDILQDWIRKVQSSRINLNKNWARRPYSK
jgi:hypothetical protein